MSATCHMLLSVEVHCEIAMEYGAQCHGSWVSMVIAAFHTWTAGSSWVINVVIQPMALFIAVGSTLSISSKGEYLCGVC